VGDDPKTAPDVGIYLAALQFEIGTASSDPHYVIFGVTGAGIDEEDFEAAIEAADEWVNSTFGENENAVPEPSGLLLAALAVIGGACVRRRRRR
ncbi:MAG: PEP-CTERM sorting domain-containing protein, partial [Pirellulales bacterium]|nr:PEP-CTERM sorting domain-containing protein [Pirellulales bacterium]